MKKRMILSALSALIYLLAGIFTLTSCQEEEEKWNPRDHVSYWGYFEAKINGEDISLINKSYETYTNKVVWRRGYAPGTTTVRVKGVVIRLFYGRDSDGHVNKQITLMLTKPDIGEISIVDKWPYMEYINYDTMCNVNTIEALIVTDRAHLYEIHPDEPFTVKITDIVYREDGYPHIIEGELDGKLYDKETGEAMEIHGKFGTK